MAPPARWTAERVLQAAASLYGQSVDASERRRADRELSAFQHCDSAVQISLALLTDTSAASIAALGPTVGPALALLLAQTVRKRLQRAGSLKGAAPGPEELLQLAESFHLRDARIADTLARAGAALWLHTGAPPVEQLLQSLASAGATPRGFVTLVALAALPEEANGKEASGPERAEVLRSLSLAATRVLSGLASLAEMPAEPRLAAAASWLGIADAAEALTPLSSSPLVPLALQCAADGADAGRAACEFLDVLLKQSGSSPAALTPLVGVVLGLLAAAQPATAAARRALGKFVAEAVAAWSWLFVTAGAAPAAHWEQLLEVLLSCSTWGLEPAAATLPAWMALHGAATRAGLSAAYAPVFARAVRVLRAASRFPIGFEAFPLVEQDAFRDFRDELRDLLRRLVDREALPAFLGEVSGEALVSPAEPWQHREEPLHALSAVAGAICPACSGEAGRALEPALVVLRTLTALGGTASAGLAGHRQLLCTFLVCASVYVPVLALPHRRPGVAQGLDAALGQVLEIARFSLGIPQECSEGPDAAFPFRAKQDHAGAVCILKVCMGCGLEIASGEAEVFRVLREDHGAQLGAALRQAPGALQAPALLVLTQALCLVAAHRPELAQGLLADCLAAVTAGGGQASLALASAAEVVQRCKAQADAIGRALDASWGSIAEACKVPGDPVPLSRLLAAVAEAAPAGTLEALARLVAQTFGQRPEARVALFGPAVALAHRAKAEPGAARLVEELLLGLGGLAWAELDREGRAGHRLRTVPGAEVRHPGDDGLEALEMGAEERALLEAWMRCVCETGRAVPGALGAEAAQLALRAAASALAVPHLDPPARTLGLLSEAWSDAALSTRWREALEAEVLPEGWRVGALLLRGLLKALLGQMPATAVGVVTPAARGLLLAAGAQGFGAWARRAVDGEGFPNGCTKVEAKERFIKDLVEAQQNTSHFKQLLKRFCTAK